MPGFPLFELHSTLLEKIITKIEGKGYLHLQQTCKDMAEFVRANRNIRVCVNENGWLEWKREKNEPVEAMACYIQGISVDVETLYGVRFAQLSPPGNYNNFDLFCDKLKSYRITCSHLDLNFDTRWVKKEPPKDQCAELFKILKPSSIEMDSKGSDRFESLRTLKKTEKMGEIYVEVHPEHALSALSIASRFSDVLIYTFIDDRNSRSFNTETFFKLLKEALQFLASEPSNLQDFAFFILCDERLPPIRKQRKRLLEFDPVFVKKGYKEAQIFKCKLGPGGPFFRLTLSRSQGSVRYIQDISEMLNELAIDSD